MPWEPKKRLKSFRIFCFFFFSMSFVMRKTFGSLMLHIGVTEYANLANSIDKSEVEGDIKHIEENLKLPFKALETGFGVKKEELDPASRHYLAMKKLVKDNNLDGLAIRCWPELPGPPEAGGLDQWCYMALARLATEGKMKSPSKSFESYHCDLLFRIANSLRRRRRWLSGIFGWKVFGLWRGLPLRLA